MLSEKVVVWFVLLFFSLVAEAGKEIQLGKNKIYDYEYKTVVQSKEGQELPHPDRLDSGLVQAGRGLSTEKHFSVFKKPDLPPVRQNPHSSRP